MPPTAAADLLAPFITELDRYLVRSVDPVAIDRAHRIDPKILHDLADLGVFGVSIPEAYGGAGLGLGGAVAVVEALARRDRAVATTVGLHLGLGTRGLVAFGSDAQRERWLPKLASGRAIGAFATTEPGAGSDLARLSTRAVVRGDRVRVTGEKIYVTNGGLASIYTMSVATDGFGEHQAARALLVAERDDAGLTVGREEDKLGLRGSSTTPLHLDLDLAADRLIGPPGAGPDHLAHVLAWGRTAMAAGCCGTAQSALDKALAHTALRHQFGRPLIAQPVVRAQLAEMTAILFAMRALVRATVAAVDAAALERLSLASKVFASDGDWQICDLALQLHGGAGYLEETGVALLIRDARVTRIFEGANDVLLTRIGQLALTQREPDVADRSAEVAEITGVFDEVLEAARRRGLAALRQPRLLHRLGRIAMLRDAALATWTRAAGCSADETVARYALAALTRSAVAAAATPDHDDADAVLAALGVSGA